MTSQPEALRLARKFEEIGFVGDHRFAKDKWCREAAAELRRLHAENQQLHEQMAAIGAGGVESLRKTNPPKDWLAAVPTLSPDFAVQVPPFTPLAQHKLTALLSQGFRVTGYSIERADIADWAPQRGFVTHGGLVGWWLPHAAAADQQQEAEHHGQPT